MIEIEEHKPNHEECHMNYRCVHYETCPMTTFHRIISGKWKILILWYLTNGALRFSDLKRKLPDVTHRMLTNQLRSLEEDKLVKRKVYPEVPPRVEYSLSELGEDMIPLLEGMYKYGIVYSRKKDK
ncbi:MAG: helix-turn-helix transcriptional regulator [Clostridium sp.]|uniref:winged helix-turn-helix transcriptional regulator n=1 Tax=Clostridium sp. DSM 8431 TaxID=1761781 RepID=UPI0008F24F67|nr:helix-turn-helix domain-containing protein [Clostridium sp. DSM 8431]MCR4943872.1 helix-turn-helix transcriptional regulator [Clostridium sp.]SFU64660.1 transcriptional regulator, HxlR family [Clostridium sp. DSM 8431]